MKSNFLFFTLRMAVILSTLGFMLPQVEKALDALDRASLGVLSIADGARLMNFNPNPTSKDFWIYY